MIGPEARNIGWASESEVIYIKSVRKHGGSALLFTQATDAREGARPLVDSGLPMEAENKKAPKGKNASGRCVYSENYDRLRESLILNGLIIRYLY